MAESQTITEPTLEPCPLAHEVREGINLWSSSAGQKWHIWCYDCGLQFEGRLNQPKDEVIKTWNSRVSAPSIAAEGDMESLDNAARRVAEKCFTIMERYCVCMSGDSGAEASPLSAEDLNEIRKRRAGMLFPDGRPTGAWLDIDRLLAHAEALRRAVNVRTVAISNQLAIINDLRAPASTVAPVEQSEDAETLVKQWIGTLQDGSRVTDEDAEDLVFRIIAHRPDIRRIQDPFRKPLPVFEPPPEVEEINQ